MADDASLVLAANAEAPKLAHAALSAKPITQIIYLTSRQCGEYVWICRYFISYDCCPAPSRLQLDNFALQMLAKLPDI